MAIALFILMVFAFFAFGLGATRLLLKGTAFESYTFEAAFLLAPMLLILVFSTAGYRDPTSISAAQAWSVLVLGTLLTAIICFRDRRTLGAIFRDNWRRLAIVLSGAAWAAAVLFFYFHGNIWDNFYHLGNGEYINYAHLAALQTGHWTPTVHLPVPPFLHNHHFLRYGQDVVTATTALIASHHPLNVVFALSIFYRFQYALAVGLVLHGIVDVRRRIWLVPLLLFMHGYLLVETYSFTSSWMSSNCTISLYVIYLTLLAGGDNLFAWRMIVLGVLANLFFLLTYPEFLAVVKTFEVGLLVVWAVRQRLECWKPVLFVNLATVLLNPVLVAQRTTAAFRQVAGGVGCNILGDPKRTPLEYLGNLLSLHYAQVPDAPFAGRQWLVALLGVVTLAGVVGGGIVLIRKHRLGFAATAWAGLVVFLHLMPVIEGGNNFYGALKFVTMTAFAPLAALLAFCQVNARFVRVLACAGVLAWGMCAAIATVEIFAKLPRYTEIYDYRAMCGQVRAHRQEDRPIACLVRTPALFLWNFAANEMGVPFVPLSTEQYAQLERMESAPQQTVWGPNTPEKFDGLFVIEDSVFASSTWAHCAIQVIGAVEGQSVTVLSEGHLLRFQLRKALARVGATHLYDGTMMNSSVFDEDFQPPRMRK